MNYNFPSIKPFALFFGDCSDFYSFLDTTKPLLRRELCRQRGSRFGRRFLLCKTLTHPHCCAARQSSTAPRPSASLWRPHRKRRGHRGRNVEIGSEVVVPGSRHPRRHHPARQDHHRRRAASSLLTLIEDSTVDETPPSTPARSTSRPPRPPQQHRATHVRINTVYRLRCACRRHVETKNSTLPGATPSAT